MREKSGAISGPAIACAPNEDSAFPRRLFWLSRGPAWASPCYRVAFADVRNHLATKKVLELIGGDLFIWHSLTELHLEGRWVKATPATGDTIRSFTTTIKRGANTWNT